MISKASYEQAAVQFFKSNTREFERYYSTTLIKQVVEEMLQSLPSQVAARLAFQRLVANGTLPRTDGKDEASDRDEAVAAAQANLDRAIAEVDAAPLTRSELEYFGSLSPHQVSALYYGEDGNAINEFAVRYNRACREFGFVSPPRFTDQGNR
jgi:hypothetical protein